MELRAASASHKIDWRWVKGHTGHTENERCDELANTAVIANGLLTDEGFDGQPFRLVTGFPER